MNFIIKMIVCIFLMLYTVHNVQSGKLGGVSPETWSRKCKTHFEKHGDKAVGKPIYISGYCERYYCQKYGQEMYGVTTDECRKFTNYSSKCKVVQNKPNDLYPFCCPKLVCET